MAKNVKKSKKNRNAADSKSQQPEVKHPVAEQLWNVKGEVTGFTGHGQSSKASDVSKGKAVLMDAKVTEKLYAEVIETKYFTSSSAWVKAQMVDAGLPYTHAFIVKPDMQKTVTKLLSDGMEASL